jgi:phosphate starvation-inducible PhoH-like protein
MVPVLKEAEKAESVVLALDDAACARELFGEYDRNLKAMEGLLKVRINARGGRLNITGPREEVRMAEMVISNLYSAVSSGTRLEHRDIEHSVRMVRGGAGPAAAEVLDDTILVSNKQKRVTPKTVNQKAYVDAIRKHDIVFGIGPAGTGKTYLAMAMAVGSLTRREVERIILTRPAVEAGEKLGFLPGDLNEKVNPYLRPLYDALHDMLDFEKTQRLIERGIIEVAPLAFMRGRTLNASFVILDEAQNTTREQMKMFLTRLGFDSKAVVTGDITQIDLPKSVKSGLVEARELFTKIKGINFSYFTEKDVIRHPIVQEIIRAYVAAG